MYTLFLTCPHPPLLITTPTSICTLLDYNPYILFSTRWLMENVGVSRCWWGMVVYRNKVNVSGTCTLLQVFFLHDGHPYTFFLLVDFKVILGASICSWIMLFSKQWIACTQTSFYYCAIRYICPGTVQGTVRVNRMDTLATIVRSMDRVMQGYSAIGLGT